MPLPPRPTALLIALLVGGMWSGSAVALDLPAVGRSGDKSQRQPSSLLPPGQNFQTDEGAQRDPKDAARQAQQINGGGRVLSVDEARGGWRVKLLKDGNVRIVFVPN